MKNEFTVKISYTDLLNVIVDFYKNVEGIELKYTDVYAFKKYLLNSRNVKSNIDVFSMNNELGVSYFDIPVEDIFKIYSLHLSKINFELVDIVYSDWVHVNYRIKGKRNVNSTIEEYDPTDERTESTGRAKK